MLRFCYRGALLSYLLLIILTMAWELWLAPAQSGPGIAILKLLGLLWPLMGLLRGRLYTYQWASMYILLYFSEGVMRCWSEAGLSSALAGAEVLLTLVFFWSAIYFCRFGKAACREAGLSTRGIPPGL